MDDVQCTMYDESVNCQLSIVNYQLSTKRSDNSYNSLTPKKLSTCETLVINKNVVHYNLPDEHRYPLQLDPHRVALSIAKGIRANHSIITIDWRYRLPVFFWRLVPRWVWVRLKVASK